MAGLSPERRLAEDLLVLARRHPREGWRGSPALGELARFWLERHTMFRRLDELIRTTTQAALDRRVDPDELRPWLARHLRFGLAQLEEHHRVEDLHYFPTFRLVEPRLLPGFELLERDHEAIHAGMEAIAERARPVLATSAGGGASHADLARFRDAHRAQGTLLIRHLDDEEDLVIPLLLEHGEATLAGGA